MLRPFFGVPEALLSDRGINLLSHLMLDVCKLLGIKKLNTTAYHPQCDGMVERFNSTLKAMILSIEDPDITAQKVYFPGDGQIRVHQSRVCDCPLGFPAGYFWYGGNVKVQDAHQNGCKVFWLMVLVKMEQEPNLLKLENSLLVFLLTKTAPDLNNRTNPQFRSATR